MHIKRIRVQNLRAIKDCTMTLDGLTALVGPNGAGKSTFLHALMLFQGDRVARRDDYYNGDTGRDIRIQIAFAGLPGPLSRIFPKYTWNSELGIARVIRWVDGKAVSTLHGCLPGNPDFKAVLNEHSVRSARMRYADLCKKPAYKNFPRWSSYATTRGYLLGWEWKNPDKFDARYDDEDLAGNSADGAALLSTYIRFVHIPAVRDAAEGERKGGGGSVLGGHLDATIEKGIAEKAEFQDGPRAGIKAMYDALMGGKGLPEVDGIKTEAGRTLGEIVPGAGLDLEWLPPDPDVGLPRAEPRLVEDGYSSPVDAAGHGLQRAFVIAALLHRPPRTQAGGAAAGGSRAEPSLVLAIEEPELYQHPARLRHLAALFRTAAERGLDGVAADRVQIIYATHSPLLVSTDRIDRIRLVNKSRPKGSGPMTARVASVTPDDVLRELKRRNAVHKDDDAVDYRILQAMDPDASEGLFASAVVLVEGESDRVAIESAAEIMGRPLGTLDVSVMSCGSKSAIPLPLVVFSRLGIPVYAVWDADQNAGRQKEESERILSVLGHGGAEWRGKVAGSFTCLATSLENTINEDLKKALGPDAGDHPYDDILEKRRNLHGLGRLASKPLKTRLVMEEAADKKLHLETLESIVTQIAKLAGSQEPA